MMWGETMTIGSFDDRDLLIPIGFSSEVVLLYESKEMLLVARTKDHPAELID